MKPKVTTWGLIRAMVKRGYWFEVGPHHGSMSGFWARFTLMEVINEAPECDECGQAVLFDCWNGAGHADTPHQAVVMAAKIALGKEVTVPSSEHFKL